MPSHKKSDLKAILKKKISAQLNQTPKTWRGLKGARHKIGRRQYRIPNHIRVAVNKTGNMFGCHSCLSLISIDKNQPWIGDHIPPTNLKNSARQHYGCSLRTVLYPQCDVCASAQSALVKKLNCLTTFPKLTARQLKLIRGNTHAQCIPSSGPKVSVGEGLQIQALGEQNGCHSCRTKYPVSTYHSDHIIPQEFMTSYMPQVLKLLGLPEIDFDQLEVRPQCPRCSHRQGGKLNEISRLAIKFARTNNITVYK
jgi:hypothetical protein